MHTSCPLQPVDRRRRTDGTEDKSLLVRRRILVGTHIVGFKEECIHLIDKAHRHCFDAGTPLRPTSACRSMQHRWRSSSIRWYLRIVRVLVDSAQLFVHSIANALHQSAALFHEDITCSVVALRSQSQVTT
jgi:hypothetical protein